MVDLDALKALLEKATPGPWECGVKVICDCGSSPHCWHQYEAQNDIFPPLGESGPVATVSAVEYDNAEWLTALHNAAPAMIAELEAAREDLKAAKAALDTFSRAYVVSMEPFISGIDQADGASHWMPGGWPTVGEFKAAHEALTAIRAAKGGA